MTNHTQDDTSDYIEFKGSNPPEWLNDEDLQHVVNVTMGHKTKCFSLDNLAPLHNYRIHRKHAPSQLTLEAGKWYQRRDGKVVGPAKKHYKSVRYPYRLNNFVYTNTGRWDGIGRVHSYDLIKEVPGPDAQEQDPQPGQWYQNQWQDIAWSVSLHDESVGYLDEDGNFYPLVGIGGCNLEWTHLPNCTGFDWEPEPEELTAEDVEEDDLPPGKIKLQQYLCWGGGKEGLLWISPYRNKAPHSIDSAPYGEPVIVDDPRS